MPNNDDDDDAVVEDDDDKAAASADTADASAAGGDKQPFTAATPTQVTPGKRTLKKVKTMFYVGTEVRSLCVLSRLLLT